MNEKINNKKILKPEALLNILEDLEEEKKKAEKYLDLTGNLILALNSNGEITMLNKEGYKILGYKEGILIGKNWFETCLPKKIIKPVKEVFAKLITGKGKLVENYESPILTSRGEERLISWHNTLLNGLPGKISGILSSGEDITERKKVEEFLKQSEEQFQSLFNSMREGFALCEVILDKKGKPIDYRFLKINPSFGEQSGMDINKTIGKTIKEIYPDIEPIWIKRYGDVAITQKSIHFEDYNKNTKKYYDVVAFSPSKNKFAMLFNDITERKKSEEFLKQSKEKYQSLFNNLLDGFAYYKIVTDEKGKPIDYIFLDVNNNFSKLTGIKDHGILVGKKITEILPGIEKDPADWIGKYGKVALTGKGIRFEQFSKELKKWYSVNAYSPKKGYFATIFEDITHRKKIESELNKSAFYLDSIPNSLIVLSPEGKITKINKSFSRLFGYSAEEIIGKSVFMLFPNEDISLHKKEMQLAIKTNTTRIFEATALTKIRKKIPIELMGLVLKDKEGNVRNFVAIVSDITERKKSEEFLKQSEAKYKSLIEDSPISIYLTDSNGSCTYVNNIWRQHSGLTLNEALKDGWKKGIHPEDKDLVFKNWKKMIDSKGDWGLEYRFVDRKGKITWVNGTINALKNKKGEIIGYIGINTNITEKKKAENEIKRLNEELKGKAKVSEEKYKTIYKSSADAIMTLEPPTWKFTSGNPATIKMFKVRDEKDFTSRAPWQYSPKYQPDKKLSSVKAKEMIEKAMKDGSNFFEWIHRRINDEDFPATVSLSKINIGGKDLLQATVRDISKLKEDEIKLKQSYEKLKVLDKLKSNFLTISSHELKTPLTPTKIQVQMFLEGELGELNKNQKKSFEIISRNINRLDKLIGDILEISRVQAEGFKLKLDNVNLGNCIKEVFKSMEDIAKKKKIKLSYKIYPLPIIFVDRKRIIEVLENLVNNSLKFTEKGSIIIEAKKQKENILIMIKDTGIGVSKMHLDKIFEPFFQIEPTYTRRYGGTGLGLGISKGIIKQHKGEIWVKSELGKGTTFYFTLPLKPKIKPELVKKKYFLKNKIKSKTLLA